MLRYHRDEEQTREAAMMSRLTEERAHRTRSRMRFTIRTQAQATIAARRGVSLHRRKYFISSNTITVIGQLYMLTACTGRRCLVFLVFFAFFKMEKKKKQVSESLVGNGGILGDLVPC